MSRAKRCVACGHTEADHDDAIMGARIGEDWYCHQADHSCYIDVRLAGHLSESIEQLLRAVPSRHT